MLTNSHPIFSLIGSVLCLFPFPHAILFGGARFGGFGLPNLYTAQGYGQLKVLVEHLKLADETGQLIRISLSHLQIHIGSVTPVLRLAFAPYAKWIDNSWLTSICKHATLLSIEIEIGDQWIPTGSRVHDAMIMDMVLQYNFSPNSLRQINMCRLYLQVLAISDIVSADGFSLLPMAVKGERDSHRVGKLHWLQQQCPPDAVWAPWNLFLYHVSTRGRLHQSLGDWIVTPHQQWEWYTHLRLQSIFHFSMETKQWQEFQPMVPSHP
jgi:hypothetical protein